MSRHKKNSQKRNNSFSILEQSNNNGETNYKDDRITHSNFKNYVFNYTNFHRAAVTGSVFENCKFINCNFNDADFEFCEFVNCDFNIKEIANCSFNNSNFICSKINNVCFVGCTFTNTFFTKTHFNSVSIQFSTLEGACFHECSFSNLDWRDLNLEYTEFIDPIMQNVALPFWQIPYMFGMLDYIASTEDDISFYYNNHKMNLKEFKENGINTLIEECDNHPTKFPKINMLLFYKHDDDQAFGFLIDELLQLKSLRDYRGIKHCCKLIALSQRFTEKQLNQFYNSIISLDASLDPLSPQMKSFSRHIGEIRAILYNRKSNKSIKAKFKTNIGISENIGFSTLCSLMHKFAKSHEPENTYVKFILEYNSPLIINVEIEGNLESLSIALKALVLLAIGSSEHIDSYPFLRSTVNLQPVGTSSTFINDAISAHNKLISLGICLNIVDYLVENCEDCLEVGDSSYYSSEKVELNGEGGALLLNHAS